MVNVYLRRGRSGRNRLITNENDIIEALVKRGFVVADIERDNLETLLGTLCNAETVVSLEGSHVAHCCFSLRELLLYAQPADRFCKDTFRMSPS